jgi:hypothetical protein
VTADRELLELAAKAAGITEYTYCELVGNSPALYCRQSPLGIWAPLTDDGDSLRLAVKLRITITYQGAATSCFTVNDDGTSAAESIQPHDDPATATRRAIVRAAAEIGTTSVQGIAR